MNILKARNQLHQITQNNPETQHFNYFKPHSTPHDPHYINNWITQRHSKLVHSNNSHGHSLIKQSIKDSSQKTINQQKVEVKTPIFKKKNDQHSPFSQKQRFQKLGLQNFLRQTSIEKKTIQKHDQPEEQKIIKNLNNTYFHSTQHIHGRRKNMVNSLGIKRSSMSNYKVEWDQKDLKELQIEWKQIGYIPNKVFPCRKNGGAKNKIYTPKKQDSTQKIFKEPTQKKSPKDLSILQKLNSTSLLQSKQLGPRNSLKSLSQKTKSLNCSRIMNKDKRMSINSSKALNRSQELVNKNQVSGVFTIEQIRPRSEYQKRPWTSKQLVMRNQKISEYLNKKIIDKRYQQSANRSFHNFNQSTTEEKNNPKLPVKTKRQIQENTDFVKGTQINIHQGF